MAMSFKKRIKHKSPGLEKSTVLNRMSVLLTTRSCGLRERTVLRIERGVRIVFVADWEAQELGTIESDPWIKS